MKDTLARKVNLPKAARRKVYFDTKKIEQGQAVINFFAPSATKGVSVDNYISNPYPGDDARLVYGLTFTLTSQLLAADASNNIDALKIINEIKDAGVVANADQDYKEFLRVPLSDHFNFTDTHLNNALSLNADGSALDSAKTVIMQDYGIYRVADPFVVAPQQNLNLYVQFNDASNFPSSEDWTAAGQQPLHMQCKLMVAELTPEMQNN
jgi:hypothetical protein